MADCHCIIFHPQKPEVIEEVKANLKHCMEIGDTRGATLHAAMLTPCPARE
jgi:hypothetical protein